MIPELGHLALIIGFCLAVAQGGYGLIGAAANKPAYMAVTRPAAIGQFVFTCLAFGALTYAFIVNDFSVAYVATNSNSALPLVYRISAVWGAHEGSLVLWLLVQSIWTVAVAVRSFELPDRFISRVLGVLGLVSAGFFLFSLHTSNPFLRLVPAALEGQDLNPLLQDPGLAIHPPILYVGYVGFSVAFAFAMAAMIEGRLDQTWARWTRPWTLAAWMFLTVGIALGSWWAYYELGWGGWWFWDPVENASFMPWLVGTALIHSLAVSDKRGLFKSWTLLLAVLAFSLSLLGTFLVRSGVLISVHSFAADPTRGAFILGFLGIVVLSALILYGIRAPKFVSRGGFDLLSRETALLINNVLLVVAAGAVLSGTLYPLIVDALGLEKVSVGPQVFNSFFVPLTLMAATAMGVGMHIAWRRGQGEVLRARLKGPLIAALALAVLVPWLIYGRTSLIVVAGSAAAFWTFASVLTEPLKRLRERRKIPAGMAGMLIAHFGVGMVILGVTVVSAYGVKADIAMRPGDTTDVAGYTFAFESIDDVQGPNYMAQRAAILISRDGSEITRLYPEKRVYRVQRSPMTEAGIDGRLHRDLFVAMGDSLGDGAYSFRVQYKPTIRFIWLGALIMAIGGAFAVADRRLRFKKPSPVTGGAEVVA